MSEPERVKIGGDRHYKVDSGDAYPSVTTITGTDPEKSKKIEQFRAKHDDPDHVRDRAGLLGTLAHHRILDPYAVRKLPPPEVDLSLADDDMMGDIETCEYLWEQCNFEMGDSPYIEQRIVSHEYEYAGTLDALVNGETVMDLKTSKHAFPTHRMQLAAYWHAANEMPDLPNPTEGAIVVIHPHPDNNPKMTPKVFRFDTDDLSEWFERFVELREAYRE